MNVLPHLPAYMRAKLAPRSYLSVRRNPVYSVVAFNEFGDIDSHWDSPPRDVEPYPPLGTPFNEAVLEQLGRFQAEVVARGAALFVTFPGLQSASFRTTKEEIQVVEDAIRNGTWCVVGTAERYRVPDSLIFDTPYHLSREGSQYRTRLLVDDLLEHGAYRAFNEGRGLPEHEDGGMGCRP